MNKQKIKFYGMFCIHIFILLIITWLQPESYFGYHIKPNWLLVYPWVVGYFYGPFVGAVFGLISGLFRDWLFGQIMGVGCLIGFWTGYISAYGIAVKGNRKIFYIPLQLVFLQIISDLFFVVLSLFKAVNSDFKMFVFADHLLQTVLPRGIFNLIAGLFITVLVRFIIVPKMDETLYFNDDYSEEPGSII